MEDVVREAIRDILAREIFSIEDEAYRRELTDTEVEQSELIKKLQVIFR